MKIKVLITLVLVSILGLVVFLDKNEPKELILPKSLGVGFNTTVENFLEENKNAKAFPVTEEALSNSREIVEKGYFSRIQHDFFQVGVYAFLNNELKYFALTKEAPLKSLESQKKGFIAKYVKLWGQPTFLKVVGMGRGNELGAGIFWITENIEISIAMSDGVPEKGMIFLLKANLMPEKSVDLYIHPKFEPNRKESILAPINRIINEL